jgi:hypothetical protein
MYESDLPQTFIFIVGEFDGKDARAVDQLAENIKHFGYLSMIGIQDTVNVKILDKIADYSASFNLVDGVPNNIQDIIFAANGCDS